MQQVPFNILTKLPDGTYDYQGATASLFHWIAVKLGRPYDAPISSDGDYYSKSNR